MSILDKWNKARADRQSIQYARQHLPADLPSHLLAAETQGIGFIVYDRALQYLGVIQVETGPVPKLTLFGLPESDVLNSKIEAVVVGADGYRKNVIMQPDSPDKPAEVESHTLARLWDRAGISLTKNLMFKTGAPNGPEIKKTLLTMITAQQKRREIETSRPSGKRSRKENNQVPANAMAVHATPR